MPVVKIHAPEQLPLRGLMEEKFSIWKNQLRVWLASDDALAPFLPTGQYSEWLAEEVNPLRIVALVNPGPDIDLAENATPPQIAQLLNKRQRQLDIFLSQVASCVSTNHYNTVVRHDADKGKSVYLSHNVSDSRCPIRVQLSTIEDVPQEVAGSEKADIFPI